MSIQLISSVTVGAGGVSTIDFASIPQTGIDIILKVNARATTSSRQQVLFMRINGDSGNNYNYLRLEGSGGFSNVIGVSSSNQTSLFLGQMNGDTSTSNTFSNSELYVSNYTASGVKTTSLNAAQEDNQQQAFLYVMAQRYVGTSPITSISLFPAANLFKQNTTVSLYLVSAD